MTDDAAPPPLTTPAPPLPQASAWPLWQRVAFRFLCVYFVLQVSPWNWLSAIPGVPTLIGYWRRLITSVVTVANATWFHIADTLVPVNGSGDTSFAWAQMGVYLIAAGVGALLWTALAMRVREHERLAYWFRQMLRYYVASAALSYGFIKIFLLQMPFPTLSNLATPLGDFLPMRFSWLFIGYSDKYQFFSGVAEAGAGLLLLFRPTITAGLFAATGAFINVVMINMAYDVPVKHYASHLLLSCLVLLAFDSRRMLNLLVLNRPVGANLAWTAPWNSGWRLWAARGAKLFMVWQILWLPLSSGWTRYQQLKAPPRVGPFAVGVYDVRRYAVNGRDIPFTPGDSIRWKDVIFDSDGAGSVNTQDDVFWRRYRRGYFRYRADTAAKTAAVWKVSTIPRDSTFLFTMRYEVPDSITVRLRTVIRGDSVFAELVRVPRHFQLTERQFHWLSEYNR